MACHTNLQGATPYHMEPIMGQLSQTLNVLVGDLRRHDQQLQIDLNRLLQTANKLVDEASKLQTTSEEILNQDLVDFPIK